MIIRGGNVPNNLVAPAFQQPEHPISFAMRHYVDLLANFRENYVAQLANPVGPNAF